MSTYLKHVDGKNKWKIVATAVAAYYCLVADKTRVTKSQK